VKKTNLLLLCLLLLSSPAVVQAQFGVSTNADGTLTINNYTGAGGDLIIPTNLNGSTVSGLGFQAFAHNTNITSVTIPGSISNIGEAAFSFCEALTNAVFESGTTVVPNVIFFACDNLVSVSIPEGVTSIGFNAFDSCAFTSVSIPDSVTNIGNQAFGGTALTNVPVLSNVTSFGDGIFEDCPNLTNITLSYPTIPYGMFAACSGLTNLIIPSNITDIGPSAFSQCTNLISVTIPDSVTNIESSAFSDCTSLGSVTIPASVTQIAGGTSDGDGATFQGCTNLTNLTILGSPTIGQYAFYLDPIRSVYIAGGSIGIWAFNFCTNLTQVTLGNGVTAIGEGAFLADPITNLALPDTVTNIGGDAFGSVPITSLVIPGSVNYIGNGAFSGCANLTNVIIGAGVTNIGLEGFAYCSKLTNILFLGNAPVAGDFADAPVLYNTPAIVYYLPGTTGWSNTFGAEADLPGVPTALWNPVIQASASSFGVSNGQFGFNITGTANIPIVVEACTNLANPVWTPLTTMSLTNGSVYFSDPNWTNFPVRYYGIGFP
jgi:hypothetical protein